VEGAALYSFDAYIVGINRISIEATTAPRLYSSSVWKMTMINS